MSPPAAAPQAQPLLPFAAFSASYFAHIGFFNPYFSLWLKDLGIGLPGRLRGRGQALYTVIGYGVPGVLAGLLGGLLSARFGLSSVFWACTVTALVAAACALRARRLGWEAGLPPAGGATG